MARWIERNVQRNQVNREIPEQSQQTQTHLTKVYKEWKKIEKPTLQRYRSVELLKIQPKKRLSFWLTAKDL